MGKARYVFIAQKLVLSSNATICSMHIGMSYCIVKQQLMQGFLVSAQSSCRLEMHGKSICYVFSLHRGISVR